MDLDTESKDLKVWLTKLRLIKCSHKEYFRCVFIDIEITLQSRLYSMKPTTVRKNNIHKSGKTRKTCIPMLTVVISGSGIVRDFHFH